MKKFIFSILSICFFICNFYSVSAESLVITEPPSTHYLDNEDIAIIEERYISGNLDWLTPFQKEYLLSNFRSFTTSNSCILIVRPPHSTYTELWLTDTINYDSVNNIVSSSYWTVVHPNEVLPFLAASSYGLGASGQDTSLYPLSLIYNNDIIHYLSKYLPNYGLPTPPETYTMLYNYNIYDAFYSCTPQSYDTTTGKPKTWHTEYGYNIRYRISAPNMNVYSSGHMLAYNVKYYDVFSNARFSGNAGACGTFNTYKNTSTPYTMKSDSCLTLTIDSIKYYFCPIKPTNDNTIYVQDTSLNNNLDITNSKLDSLNGLVSSGNTTSSAATNSNNQSNNRLDSTVNNFDNIENQYNNNLKNELSKIDPTSFTPNSTKFLNAMNFVKVNFDTLIKDSGSNNFNPFGVTLGFSLMLGLALLIIRKRL